MHHSVIVLYNNRKTQTILNLSYSLIQSLPGVFIIYTKQQVTSLYCEKYNYKTYNTSLREAEQIKKRKCQHMETLWLPEFSDCQHADTND